MRVCAGAVELDRPHRARRARTAAGLGCWDDDGYLQIRGRFRPENGAVLIASWQAGLDALDRDDEHGTGLPHRRPRPHDPGTDPESDPDPWGDGDGAPSASAEAPHPDLEQIRQRLRRGVAPSGRGHLATGPALSPRTLRRLACTTRVIGLIRLALTRRRTHSHRQTHPASGSSASSDT